MNPNLCNCCGGEFEYRGGRWICNSCGSYRAESVTNEEAALLYTAYRKLRLAEFAEAELEFDDFIRRYPENHNGYWGRLMSKYGIKYERDFDGRMIPTCYAGSIGSVFSASDYKKTLQYADAESRAFYENQAGYIERMRKEWQEKAKKEKPYDIFICYKDSDLAKGVDRTKDSYAAQELYTLLTGMGYRVFYSRVSLRDKTGERYEPYIFHALSTAKVMIVYGSDPDYIQSTWMKNEWMRYAKQIREGKKKQDSLLVACDGFAPEELPTAPSSMQCFRADEKTFYGDLQSRVSELIGGGENARGQYDTVSRKKRRRFRWVPLTLTLLFVIWLGISYAKSKGPADLTFESNGTCYLTNVSINGDTHVDIPSEYEGQRVTGIGKDAFSFSYGLQSVTVPEGVTKIEKQAFAYCDDLQSVSLPESVTSIGDYAFADCGNLRWITIPGNVTEIGEYAFSNCVELTSITIPESVTTIGDLAFHGCKNLAGVIIEGKLMSVGNSVFSSCKSLMSVTFDEGTMLIGESMFSDCIALTKVKLPSTVTFVESYAFSGCFGLTEIHFSENLKTIDYSAFENCTALTEIRYGGTVAQWEKIDFRFDWNTNTGDYVVHCTDGSVNKTEA